MVIDEVHLHVDGVMDLPSGMIIEVHRLEERTLILSVEHHQARLEEEDHRIHHEDVILSIMVADQFLPIDGI